ncbi:MAG: MMPL family transporter, partial [Deltaproteobacteria bacterium]|nr:MMPL family transporter [Deltaproteobacteria bacterium]
MKNFINPILIKLNQAFTATPNAIRPYRWRIISLFLILSIVSGWGLSKFQMDMSMESFFTDDDPFLKGYDQFKRDFGSDDSIYLVFEAKDGDIFSEKSIRLTHELTEDLENWRQIQGIGIQQDSMLKRMVKITSLTNSRYQLTRGDDLISAKMVRERPPKTPAELKSFKELAQTQESFEGFLYAKSMDYGGLSIKTDFGMTLKEPIEAEETGIAEDAGMEDDFSMEVDSEAAVTDVEFEDENFNNYVLLMDDFNKIINQPKYLEHFNFHALGNPPLYHWSMSMMGEMGILGILLLVIIIGLLWSLLRSFAAVLWPILIIIMSSLMITGGTAIIGAKQSSMISLTVMLIITVGVAASVHVMSTYLLYRREDKDHEEALSLSYRKTGVPIMIASLTTMGGMLAIGGTGLPFMVVFAVQSALGIALTGLMIWTLLPILLDIWHPLKGKNGRENTAKIGLLGRFFSAIWLQPMLDKIPGVVDRRPYKVSIFFLALVALFTYGAMEVRIDTNMVELSDKESDINRAYKIVDEKMSGGQNLQILFEFNETDSLKDLKVLAEIDKLERHLVKAYPELVRKTFSLARMLKDTNRVM